MIKKILVILIFLAGAFTRFYNLNWDSKSMLHPDERFLIMVSEKLVVPNSMVSYLDTKTSTLNPHNLGFNFYVYGTLPIIILRIIANFLSIVDISNLLILGRYISAGFDVMTAIVVYLIARKISPKSQLSIFALVAYFSTTLSLQMSHFFTVDTPLVLFSTLSIYFLIRTYSNGGKVCLLNYLLAGVCYGLAVSSKISALYLLPVILIFFTQKFIANKKFIKTLIFSLIFGVSFILTVRFGYPYLFSSSFLVTTINNEVISDWKELNYFYSHSTYESPESYIFPPATMFLSTTPVVFPFINLVNWGLGLPFTFLVLCSVYIFLKYLKSHRTPMKHIATSPWLLLCAIVISIFLIQGVQFLLYLRYFYPLVPALSIIVALVLQKIHQKNSLFSILTILLLLIWPLGFLRIYSIPHTRVQASDWIYSNIPTGSALAYEHWDDPLPLYRPNQINSRFSFVEIPLFDKESQSKWRTIYSKLNSSDYLIISSNRVFASTTALPERYPINSKYYELLFSGRLGFTKVAEFSSRPGLSLPINMCIMLPGNNYGRQVLRNTTCTGIEFVDDYADESFTVYDHPRVFIFKKTGVIPNLGI